MQKSSNPVFKSLEKRAGVTTNSATLGGITIKSIFLLFLTIVSAVITVYFGMTKGVTAGEENVIIIENWVLVVLFVGMVTSFMSVLFANIFPSAAMPLSIIYVLGEGAFLGVLSAIIDFYIPGAAVMALVGVLTIFTVMLLLYTSRAFRVTSRFRKMMFAASITILIVAIFGGIFHLMIANFFGSGAMVGIAIALTVLLILYGAFMLMLDFDYAAAISEYGFDKKYEWLAALGLMVTLIWIYVQVIRLIALLAGNRD